MKSASIAALAATFGVACAFMPATPMVNRAVAKSSMQMAVDDMLGADVETGGVWDPLNFSKDEKSLFRRRAVELKHGRIAMLACLGYWVQSAGIHAPDPVFSESKPFDALGRVLSERPEAAIQVLAAIAWIENVAGKQDYENKAPGDIGTFGDAFKPEDPEEFAALQVKELKNGRLAMLGIMGMMVQEQLTGQSPFQQIASGHISPFGDGQGFF